MPPSEEAQALLSVGDLIRWGASRFAAAGLVFAHGTDNAADEAASLVLQALHLDPRIPDHFLRARVTPSERAQVLELLDRRIRERKPAAYLTGRAWFAGLEFCVDERVLVPRSPLAELILDGFAPWVEAPAVQWLLDLCTGSGCIAVASANAFPQARVVAADVSAEALEVATINIRRHDLEDRVRAVQSDLFQALAGQQFDLIVSNPPYVSHAGLAGLAAEFRHEPRLGLEAGADGLDVTRRILCQARKFLSPHGVLVVEVGAGAQRLEEAYPEVPFTWLDFRYGGTGVFTLTAEQLGACEPALARVS